MIVVLLILLSLNSFSAQAGSPTVACVKAIFRENLSESEFGRRMIADLDSGFKDVKALNAEDSRKLMKEWENALAHFPIPKSERVTEASNTLLKKLYDRVKDNRVGNATNHPIYDPEHKLGFCFGRAMTAQIEALKLGIDKRQILKVWVVGNLDSGETKWGYHVSVLIRGTKNRWMAVDPFFAGPVELDDWYTALASHSSDGGIHTFITEAKRFLPTQPDAYERKLLNDPSYNYYFEDLLDNFRREFKVSGPSQLKPKP